MTVLIQLAFAVWLGSGLVGSAVAEPRNSGSVQLERLTTHFYTHKDPASVATLISLLGSDRFKNKNSRPPIIGLLSSIFREFPEKVPSWIGQAEGRLAKAILVQALLYAGRRNDAKELAKAIALPKKSMDWLDRQPESPLDFAISNPSQLDILWGAFFGSGDLRYVVKITEVLKRADVNANINLDDVFTIAADIRGKTPRFKEVLKQYSTSGKDLVLELVLAGTALWALGSNATQHEVIGNYIREAYGKDQEGSLTVLMRRIFFAYEHPKPVATSDGESLSGIFFASPDADDIKTVTHPENRDRPDRISSSLPRGKTFYLNQIYKVSNGVSVTFSMKVVGPDGKQVLAYGGSRPKRDQAYIFSTTTVAKGDHVQAPGIYRVTFIAESSDGQKMRVTKELFLF